MTRAHSDVNLPVCVDVTVSVCHFNKYKMYAYEFYDIHFSKILYLCWEIADFREHEQGGGHSNEK